MDNHANFASSCLPPVCNGLCMQFGQWVWPWIAAGSLQKWFTKNHVILVFWEAISVPIRRGFPKKSNRFCIFLVFVIIFLFFYFLVKDQAVGASPAGFPQLPLEGSPPPTQGLHLGKRPSTTQCHRLKPRQGAQTCPGRHRCAQTMQPWAALPHQPYRKHAYGLGGWGEGA